MSIYGWMDAVTNHLWIVISYSSLSVMSIIDFINLSTCEATLSFRMGQILQMDRFAN